MTVREAEAVGEVAQEVAEVCLELDALIPRMRKARDRVNRLLRRKTLSEEAVKQCRNAAIQLWGGTEDFSERTASLVVSLQSCLNETENRRRFFEDRDERKHLNWASDHLREQEQRLHDFLDELGAPSIKEEYRGDGAIPTRWQDAPSAAQKYWHLRLQERISLFKEQTRKDLEEATK